MLDEKMAGDFFSMARCVLSAAGEGRTEMFIDERSLCIEQVTNLAAKLAARFIRFGIMVSRKNSRLQGHTFAYTAAANGAALYSGQIRALRE